MDGLVAPERVSVTTMTFTTKLSRAVDLNRAWERIRVDDDVAGVRSPCGKFCRPDGAVPVGNSFGTQMTLVVSIGDGRKCNVKVFGNGSVQIAGARSTREAQFAESIVTRALIAATGDLETTGAGLHVLVGAASLSRQLSDANSRPFPGLDVQMINSHARVSAPVARRDMVERARELIPNVNVVFDPAMDLQLKFRFCFDTSDEAVLCRHSGECKCEGGKCAVVPVRDR